MANLLPLKKSNGWRSIKLKFAFKRDKEEDNDTDVFNMKVYWQRGSQQINMPYSRRKRWGYYTFSISRAFAGQEFVVKLFKKGVAKAVDESSIVL